MSKIEIINNIKSELPSLDKIQKKNIKGLKEACNSFIKYRGVMDNEVAELYKNYNWE
ncbi:MAG: hypothetical protein IKK64_08140 [Bacteroidales bacterium]|nr:hypothetical protein [Bacteroidales bacterium]